MTLPNPAAVLPHSGPAVLLDEILRADAAGLVARTTVRSGRALGNADGSLPAWAGLELMAQVVAAFSGWRAGQARLGLLLGTRQYTVAADAFAAGTELEVEVKLSSEDDDGFGVFDCVIRRGAEPVATASLTVLQPPDPAAFLREQLGLEAA